VEILKIYSRGWIRIGKIVRYLVWIIMVLIGMEMKNIIMIMD
jgi:hypothetical protein